MDPFLEEKILPHLDPDEQVEAMMRLHDPDRVPDHVKVISRFGDIITCRIRRGDIREVYKSPLKKSLKASRHFSFNYPGTSDHLSDNSALNYDAADLKAPTAKGVVVAVLDWGFDFAHANFRNQDGTTRLLALWDQTVDSPGFEPYDYGRLYTADDIDRALASESPYQTLGYHPAKSDPAGIGAHGTHVADLAAGNAGVGNHPMPAKDAELIFVHMATKNSTGLANLGDATRILEALDFVDRVADDRPLAINLSMGKHGGSHDGLSLVEMGMDNFLKARPDTMICQSTGNYYQANAHSMGLVRPGKTSSFSFYVNRADKTPNELEIWYSGKDEFAVTLIHESTGRVFRNRIQQKTVLRRDDGEIAGRIYHRSHEPNNGKNHVNIFLYKNAPAGNWKIKLSGKKIVDGRYHAWVERDRDCQGCKVMFDAKDSSTYYTNGSICNGFNTIVVGAYNALNPQPEIAPFSSQGPTTDGRHKPDIIAPGVGILAAKSSPRRIAKPTDELTRMSGTSMAAPQVTKTAALLLEVLPRGTPYWLIRNLIIGTAREFEKPSMRSGSGALQIPAAIEAAQRLASGLPWPEKQRNFKNHILQLNTQDIMKFNDRTGEFLSEDLPTGEFVNDHTLTEARRSAGTFKLLPHSSFPNRVYIDDASPLFSGTSFDAALQFALRRTGEAHSVITGHLYNGGNYSVFDYRKMVSFITRPVIISNLNNTVCCLVLNAMDAYFPENPLNKTSRWLLMPRMREFYALAQQDRNRHRNRWIGRLNQVRRHITIPGQTVNNTYLSSLSAPALRLLLANFSGHTYPVGTVRRRDSSGRLRDKGGIVNGVTKPLFTYPLREPECYFSVTSQAEGAMESINAWDYRAGISIGPIQFNAQRGAILKWLYILYTRDRVLFDRELGSHYNWSLRLQGGNPVLTVNTGAPDSFELSGTTNNEVRRTYGYFQSGDPNRHLWAQIVPDFRRTMAGRFAKVLAWPHVQEMVLEVSSWWAQPGMTRIRNSGLADLNTSNPDRDAFVLKSLLISTYVRFSGCLQPFIDGLNAYASVADKLSNWETALNTTSDTCQGLRDRLRSQVDHADAIHDAIQRMRAQTAAAVGAENHTGNSHADTKAFPYDDVDYKEWKEGDFETDEPTGVPVEYEESGLTPCNCGNEDYEALGQQEETDTAAFEDFTDLQDFPDDDLSRQMSDFIDEGLSFEHFLENAIKEKTGTNSPDGASNLSKLFDILSQQESNADDDPITVINRPGELISDEIRSGDILLQRSETGDVFASLITDSALISGSEAGYNTDTLVPYEDGRYLHVVATGVFPKTYHDNYAKMISEAGTRLLYDQMIIRPVF
ncbi:MAG: S8 family peptidase [Cytophagales bacterium]|nr:S8 family peptidase [Cytophagales bacterium]